jgi:hypothetical protein
MCVFLLLPASLASSALEVDLIEKKARFVDFRFGNNTINGEIFFQFQQKDKALLITLQGQDLYFNQQPISWLKARLEKRGDLIFVKELQLSDYFVTGIIDTQKKKISFDIEGNWKEDLRFLKGNITVKGKAWGSFDNILMSGYLRVDDGEYQGQKFSRLRLDLLGKPPVFNITDSEIVLHDGTTFEYVDAVLDMRDFSEPRIPNAKFVSQKVYLGQWQVFGEDEDHAGLRKNLGRRMDSFSDDSGSKEDNNISVGGGAQARYNWKDEQFLKLRMEEDRAIFGFEQRRNF